MGRLVARTQGVDYAPALHGPRFVVGASPPGWGDHAPAGGLERWRSRGRRTPHSARLRPPEIDGCLASAPRARRPYASADGARARSVSTARRPTGVLAEPVPLLRARCTNNAPYRHR